MHDIMTGLTERHLLQELDRVEEAIGRSSIFTRWLDADGRSHVRVGRELLALAEREHAILQELRRRHPLARSAFRATAA